MTLKTRYSTLERSLTSYTHEYLDGEYDEGDECADSNDEWTDEE